MFESLSNCNCQLHISWLYHLHKVWSRILKYNNQGKVSLSAKAMCRLTSLIQKREHNLLVCKSNLQAHKSHREEGSSQSGHRCDLPESRIYFLFCLGSDSSSSSNYIQRNDCCQCLNWCITSLDQCLSWYRGVRVLRVGDSGVAFPFLPEAPSKIETWSISTNRFVLL
jgi:hypothetical protein